MKKHEMVSLFGFMMGWTNIAYAQTTGGQAGNGLVQFLLLIAINGLVLFVASKIADFEQPDFWRAISCSLGIGAVLFFALVLTGHKDIQDLPIAGLVIVGVIAIVLIQRVYNTTLGKTLIASALTFVATLIAAKMLAGAL